MAKRTWMGGLLAAGLLLAACGTGTGPQPNGGDAPTAEENRLVIYTGRDTSLIEYVVGKFEEKHPEYTGQVDVMTMGAQQIMERIRAEQQNPQADLWWGGTQQALGLAAQEGLLAQIQPGFADKIADENKDPDGYWYGEILLPEVIQYNAEVISHEEAPKDWDDLLDPKWKGQILIRAVAPSGTMRTIYAAMIDRFYQEDGKPDRGYEWLLKLDANTKEYTADPNTLHLKMARREGALSLWNLQDVLIQKYQKNMPFDYIVPESGAPILVDGVAVVQNAKHPQAAAKFLEVLFSPEVQSYLAENYYQIPALQMENAEKPQWLQELEPKLKPLPLQWDVMAEKEAEWIEYWDQNIKGKGGQ